MRLQVAGLDIEAGAYTSYVTLPFIGEAVAAWEGPHGRGRTFFDTNADLEKDDKCLVVYAGKLNVGMNRPKIERLTPLWLALGGSLLIAASVLVLILARAPHLAMQPLRKIGRLFAGA